MIENFVQLFLSLLVIQSFSSTEGLSTAQLGWRPSVFTNEECREERQPVVEYYHQNNMQYLFFSQRVTWEEARMLCRSYNSRLALLDTMEKALGVARSIAESNIVMEDTWLGGRRIDFVWYWIEKEIGPWKNEISMEANIEDYPPWSREPTRPTKECLAIDRRSHEHPNFIDLDCRLQRPFICEKKEGEIITSPVPSKWVQINRNTYTLYHGRVTWQEAATFCRTQGARLAILKSSIVINILTNSMTKTRPDFESVWIGAHYSYGQWVWMATGSVLNSLTNESGYPPWRFGRPEKNDGCLLLDRHIEDNSTFVETTCDRKRDFICEEYSDGDEDDWMDEPVKFSYENSTYIIYPIHKSWKEARKFCSERGSVLAHVDHIDPINLIIEAMGDHPREISHVWLGGVYTKKSDEWRWIDNDKEIAKERDEFGFPPWAQIDGEMETDSESSMCLNLDRTDHVKPHFYGLECNSKQSFVCKITCDVPPPIENGNWSCSDVTDGRQCLLQCNENLITMGIENITCTFRNGWTSGNDLMEFPLCLKPEEYASRMIRALSQDIQKSSGYYLILDHLSNSMKSKSLDLFERIVTAFPASHNLKIGMTTYATEPPAHLPFNQTDKCSVISDVKYLRNNVFATTTTKINISGIYKDISLYNGRRISIIAILDSTRGVFYKDALMQFKSAGHHVVIVGLREDADLLLPMATIGFDRRVNLFLFQEKELKVITKELKNHEKRKSRCADTNSKTSNLQYLTGIENDPSSQKIIVDSSEKLSSIAPVPIPSTDNPLDNNWGVKSPAMLTTQKPYDSTTESDYDESPNENSQEISSSTAAISPSSSQRVHQDQDDVLNENKNKNQDQVKRETPETEDEE